MYFDAGHPPFEAAQPLVLKIGGSLMQQSATLRTVLDVVNRAQRAIAVVAGGGAIADAVREAQARLGFSDRAAHRMAILALHQNAFAMTAFAPCLTPLETLTDIETALANGEKAVWLPLLECDADADLPASWDATSDAIAARLAERLGGLPIVFVKSRGASAASKDPADLAAENLIDPVSAAILLRSGMPYSVINSGQMPLLAKLLGASDTIDATQRA